MKPVRLTLMLSAAALATATLSLGAIAASMVEIRSDGDITKIYIDGKQGRMEPGRDEGYILVDQATGKVVMVMPSEGRAMDMSGMLKQSGGAAPGASLTPAGNGPTIAGYSTKRFKYTVAGQQCGTVYVSRDALRDSGAGFFMDVMARMADSASAFTAAADPCDRGAGALPKALKEQGLPMRVEDASGRLESEVTRVDRNATLPPNAFGMPEGVQVQDAAAMQSAMRQHASQMETMMQQMEQSGQMPPELLEQMRKAREQYGR